MRHDLFYSLILHIVVVLAMVVSVPFKPRVRTDLDNVIKVNLAYMPAAAKAAAIKPAAVIKGATTEKTTPIPDKTTAKSKPVTKPKPKKPAEKTPQTLEKGEQEKAGAPAGQVDVSNELGAGSPFGSASIDNASFEYPYWFVQAFSKIERNWSNPVYSNEPLSCIIYFHVIRSGRIIDVQIEKSSGFDAFDRACETAVRLSEPLPPLPDDFTDEIIGIHLEFPYIPQ
ncbi:putative Periplasmic protein TonB [Candidatus Zixiibacteriota bacterium]|nr:putative Periplasmic protein TonB [candidate division Zixibacteria bacterium]